MSDVQNGTAIEETQDKAELPHVIKANHDNKVDIKEVTYTFRKTKDEETGVEKKRANIEMKLPVLSVEGLIAVIENGGKELELLQEVAAQAIVDRAKEILGDDESLTADNFPYEQVTWSAIANEPASERRGRGIPKELWEEFIKSYIAIMPAVSGKTVENIKRQAAIIAAKFQPLKHHEKRDQLLPGFQSMLTVYASAAPEAEQFAAILEFLTKKIDQFMKQESDSDISTKLGF